MSQRSRAAPWFRDAERYSSECADYDAAQGHEFAVMRSPSPRKQLLEGVWVREMEGKRRVERADLERVLYRSEGER